jgi:hypothetical protein
VAAEASRAYRAADFITASPFSTPDTLCDTPSSTAHPDSTLGPIRKGGGALGGAAITVARGNSGAFPLHAFPTGTGGAIELRHPIIVAARVRAQRGGAALPMEALPTRAQRTVGGVHGTVLWHQRSFLRCPLLLEPLLLLGLRRDLLRRFAVVHKGGARSIGGSVLGLRGNVTVVKRGKKAI